ncbi:DUF4338 domain-containing protein [Acidiferrobacter sp.]|uniref:DUF4338 domain-containing protein n=1 Tax=Acidiferrobacter sp. TaxID=1872107 RepID=UPI00263324F7|nr:DUF4338 domain-containing protein [Acidiferrobacter sp.]
MRYCGRDFTLSEIDRIRALIAASPKPSRYRLSQDVCAHLAWRRLDGGLKDMSCRVALLRMEKDGLITLPPPRCVKPVSYQTRPLIDTLVREPAILPMVDLARLTVDVVVQRHDSQLWNAYIAHYHYLGHKPLPGAQLRYVVRAEGVIIALLGFGAAAWKTHPRDAAIGWSAAQRQRNLPLIVNNARFLILPWIRHKNLASRILALISRRLVDDWQARYGYRPVLLETFVEKPRFTGTCYKAANWHYLGDTQGRGKLDTFHRHVKPVKSIWIYPLSLDFRQQLCNG